MDEAQLMQLFQSMLFGGGRNGFNLNPYSGSQGNFSNSMTYQPGMLQGFAQNFFTGLRPRTSPGNILQSDFLEAQSRARIQAQFAREAFSSNVRGTNLFTNMMARSGMMSRSQARSFANDLQGFNVMGLPVGQMMINQVTDPFFGPSVEQQKYQSAVQVQRSLSGFFMQGSTERGVTLDQAGDISDRLFRATFRDRSGIFRRNQNIGMREMTDIFRATVDFGGDVSNPEQIVSQTKKAADTLDFLARITGDKDIQKNIETFMNMSQGTIALSNTADATSMINRVNNLARSANVSFQAMARVVTEGASFFKQMGLDPTLGNRIFGEGAALNRGLTQGAGAIFGSDFRAKFGVTPGQIREENMRSMGVVLSSRGFQSMGNVFAGLDASGQQKFVNNLRRGIIPEYQDVKPTETKVQQDLYKNLIASGVAPGDAKRISKTQLPQELQRRAIENGTLLANRLQDELGSAEFQRLGETLRVNQIIESSGINRNIINQARQGDESSKRTIMSTVYANLRRDRRYTNVTDRELSFMTSRMVDIATMSNDQIKQQRLRDVDRRRRELLDVSLQENTRAGGPLDQITKAFIGDDDNFGFGTAFRAVAWGFIGDPAKVSSEDIDKTVNFLKTTGRDQFKRSYKEWFAKKGGAAMYNYMVSVTGKRDIVRKQIFGNNGFYDLFGAAVDMDRGKREKAYGEFLQGKTGKSIKMLKGKDKEAYEELKNSKQNFRNFAEFIKTIGGDELKKKSMDELLNDRDFVTAYVGFLDTQSGDKESKYISRYKDSKRLIKETKQALGTNLRASDASGFLGKEEKRVDDTLKVFLEGGEATLGDLEGLSGALNSYDQGTSRIKAILSKSSKELKASYLNRYEDSIAYLKDSRNDLKNLTSKRARANKDRTPDEYIKGVMKSLRIDSRAQFKKKSREVAKLMNEEKFDLAVSTLFNIPQDQKELTEVDDIKRALPDLMVASGLMEQQERGKKDAFVSPFSKMISSSGEKRQEKDSQATSTFVNTSNTLVTKISSLVDAVEKFIRVMQSQNSKSIGSQTK